ncbi:ABC transporter permease subunit [Aureimonas ureilytica]|uniref:ABC transporter permease subunit n=1 Tax=Aureimonas ureilytica TaxID=401562 RepID=UPI000370C68C|nr:ABC transporter permease subunit [Aureimonas ureilytica]
MTDAVPPTATPILGTSRALARRFSPFLPALSRAVTLLGVLVLVALLPWLSGRDPALSILRARSGDQEATAEALGAIRAQLGLDRGPWEALLTWFAGLARGDAGTSWISGAPVLPGMIEATGTSLVLMACALPVVLLVLALVCAPTVRAGLGGEARRGSGLAGAVFTSLPEFVLATSLLVVFAVWLGWFPPYGWTDWRHVVLPALAMGLPAGGLLGRLFSDGLAATFSERWVATWSIAGFSRGRILLAVVQRTLPGLLPQVGMVLIGLTGGAVAVEQVFAIPGLGRATLGAATAQDLPALQTGILILLLLAVGLGSLANLLSAHLLRPALRTGSLPVAAPEAVSRPAALLVPALALALLAVLILAGLGRDPFTSAHLRLEAPSLALPLGADGTGRDLLARVSHGAASTIVTASITAGLALLIALFAGSMPRLMAGPIEITKATPPILAGLFVAAITGPSQNGAMLAVLLTAWAPLAAHVAALSKEARAQPHVRIAPLLGVGPVRTTVRYVIPALFGPVLRHAMLRLPGIALALAALGFLGLGARPPAPEWGLVLAEGLPYVERAPFAVFVPTGALVLLAVFAVSAASLRGRRWRGRAPEPRRSHAGSNPVADI